MKSIKQIITIVAIAIFMFTSCSKNEQIDVLQDESISLKSITNLNDFKAEYPKEYNLLNVEFIQNDKGIIKTQAELKDLNFFTIPAIVNDNVVGRLLYYNGEIQYVDYTNFKNEVSIITFSKDKLKSSVMLPTIYNSVNDTYEVSLYQNKASGFLCGVGCTLATMAIIASDGPAPLMDIIALAYYSVCMAECAKE